jgi:hypothetical protein
MTADVIREFFTYAVAWQAREENPRLTNAMLWLTARRAALPPPFITLRWCYWC